MLFKRLIEKFLNRSETRGIVLSQQSLIPVTHAGMNVDNGLKCKVNEAENLEPFFIVQTNHVEHPLIFGAF